MPVPILTKKLEITYLAQYVFCRDPTRTLMGQGYHLLKKLILTLSIFYPRLVFN
jgi:hypothetical protein